ncbi:MAG TPA: replication-associated recombination protein A [Cellvibrionaceae bacterium]|nr:replication-associated recombination protein A [Cellvibrionaceae bacterium]
MTEDLFTQAPKPFGPLAARMRPAVLADYIGQEHILGLGKTLRQALERGQLHSIIFWGPPGVGKTSLARLLAHEINARFIQLSAVLAGVKDIREAVASADYELKLHGRKTLLFVDEVHRFNKAQQDAFLPFVEDGTITFVGATTENPSFEVNNALLSRCRVYVLESLKPNELAHLMQRALTDSERGLGARNLRLTPEAQQGLINAADGDGRRCLNLLEIASDLVNDGEAIDPAILARVLATDVRRFDKGGDLFYEQISALHKSMRGSDPNASLYWFMRMLDGGCDPLYIARRLVRMASEDVGNADPRALQLCLNAWDVQERLGSPEGELAMAQALLYLAAAPKSNAVYKAYNQCKEQVKSLPSFNVPMHLRNASTALMKGLDYGKAYRYAHDEPDAFAAGEHYFPTEMDEMDYYQPVPRGLEIQIGEKLKRLAHKNAEARAAMVQGDKP